MNGNGRISIGDLAKGTGTKVVTVRYYEQIGLLPVPSRTEGNYRTYSNEHMRRLRFIRRCRDLGFTLDQIRDLLRLSSQKNEDCAEVDRITANISGWDRSSNSHPAVAQEGIAAGNKPPPGGGWIIADCRKPDPGVGRRSLTCPRTLKSKPQSPLAYPHPLRHALQ